jgi:hypothetical protein
MKKLGPPSRICSMELVIVTSELCSFGFVQSNVTQGLKTNPIWVCYEDCPITEKGRFYDIVEKGGRSFN